MGSASWLRRGVLAVAFALGVACTSPTLPLPPPSQPTISVGSEPNTFRLSSDRGALPNALVIVVNRNESLPRDQCVAGTLADAQGSWALEIVANAGDVVDISQEDGATRSPTISVRLE